MVQVPVGRGKEGRKDTGVCVLEALPWGNSGSLPVCNNQRFELSGVEVATVPAELCGKALILNLNNLKRPWVVWNQCLPPWKERQMCVFLDANFYRLLLVVVPRPV